MSSLYPILKTISNNISTENFESCPFIRLLILGWLTPSFSAATHCDQPCSRISFVRMMTSLDFNESMLTSTGSVLISSNGFFIEKFLYNRYKKAPAVAEANLKATHDRCYKYTRKCTYSNAKKPLKGGYAEASNGERARRDRKSVIVLKDGGIFLLLNPCFFDGVNVFLNAPLVFTVCVENIRCTLTTLRECLRVFCATLKFLFTTGATITEDF